jgi:membrane protease subunit HflC
MAKATKALLMLWEKILSFFAFYRAMQSYETALIGGETSLVLSPDSAFFKFFGKSFKPN